MYDNFTQIEYSVDNLDIYFIRSSIFNALKENIHLLRGKLLDVGCGQMPYKKYILGNGAVKAYVGLDIESPIGYNLRTKPDLIWDGIKMPIEDAKFDAVLLTEVLEHVPDPLVILREINRILTKDGVVFFSVPYLWPLHDVPYDEFRYTPFSLKRIFETAGFNEIEIKATGGWNASLGQMLGLWVRRGNISARKRKFLSIILKPIIKFLFNKDKKPDSFFESLMVPGMVGVAKKLNQ